MYRIAGVSTGRGLVFGRLRARASSTCLVPTVRLSLHVAVPHIAAAGGATVTVGGWGASEAGIPRDSDVTTGVVSKSAHLQGRSLADPLRLRGHTEKALHPHSEGSLASLRL
jgi:hypothetical protein